MTWKDIMKVEKMLQSFNFENTYHKDRDSGMIEYSTGSGVHHFDFYQVIIKWSMTFDVKDDNLLMYKPEVESLTVTGVDIVFEDSETEDWDIEDKDIETDEFDIGFLGWEGDIGTGFHVMPMVEFDIAKVGENIILENVGILFG